MINLELHPRQSAWMKEWLTSMKKFFQLKLIIMNISGKFLFKLSDTHGLPIEIAVQEILEKGLSINWLEFIKAAQIAGWKNRKIKEKIKSAMQDLIGHDEYKKGLLERLELIND
jgi:alanyl-tRNA synthetase